MAVVLIASRPRSAVERAAVADDLAAGISVGVEVQETDLLAARAIADFGVGADVRLVLVRIVDEMAVELRIEAATDVTLASPILACLFGPDPAPDDAGLSDRCWGDERLALALDAALPADEAGRRHMVAGVPVTVRALVRRGEVGCDYPPGVWRLQLRVDPVVDGVAAGERSARSVAFETPFQPDDRLRLVEERRYCGLASKVYREQGEPIVIVPSGSVEPLVAGLRWAPAQT